MHRSSSGESASCQHTNASTYRSMHLLGIIQEVKVHGSTEICSSRSCGAVRLTVPLLQGFRIILLANIVKQVTQEMFLKLWKRQMCLKLSLVSKDFHITGGTLKLVVSCTVTLTKQISFLPGLVATEITEVTKGQVPNQ